MGNDYNIIVRLQGVFNQDIDELDHLRNRYVAVVMTREELDALACVMDPEGSWDNEERKAIIRVGERCERLRTHITDAQLNLEVDYDD